jgi:hypothetical protein
MRNVFSQLGRAVSIVAVVVLLTTPTSRGAGLLPDRDGGSGRVLGSIHRLIHQVTRWIPSVPTDELMVPRP